jgi:hypothetical protein
MNTKKGESLITKMDCGALCVCARRNDTQGPGFDVADSVIAAEAAIHCRRLSFKGKRQKGESLITKMDCGALCVCARRNDTLGSVGLWAGRMF